MSQKLTRTDRTDLDTSKVARRYLDHLIRSQDHRLTNGETSQLRAAVSALKKMEKRIEHGIDP